MSYLAIGLLLICFLGGVKENFMRDELAEMSIVPFFTLSLMKSIRETTHFPLGKNA